MTIAFGEMPQTVTEQFPYHAERKVEVAIDLFGGIFNIVTCRAKDIVGVDGKWRMRDGAFMAGSAVSFYQLPSDYEGIEK